MKVELKKVTNSIADTFLLNSTGRYFMVKIKLPNTACDLVTDHPGMIDMVVHDWMHSHGLWVSTLPVDEDMLLTLLEIHSPTEVLDLLELMK